MSAEVVRTSVGVCLNLAGIGQNSATVGQDSPKLVEVGPLSMDKRPDFGKCWRPRNAPQIIRIRPMPGQICPTLAECRSCSKVGRMYPTSTAVGTSSANVGQSRPSLGGIGRICRVSDKSDLHTACDAVRMHASDLLCIRPPKLGRNLPELSPPPRSAQRLRQHEDSRLGQAAQRHKAADLGRSGETPGAVALPAEELRSDELLDPCDPHERSAVIVPIRPRRRRRRGPPQSRPWWRARALEKERERERQAPVRHVFLRPKHRESSLAAQMQLS